MTDLPIGLDSVPTRLGVTFTVRDGALHGHLTPAPAMCDRGTVPMAALVYLCDSVAGVSIDDDPDTWAFTSQLSIRRPVGPDPARIDATNVTLRNGKRSTSSEVPLTVDGIEWATSFAAFARVPRRDSDPPKHAFDVLDALARSEFPPLDRPLREAAGFESTDPSVGAVRAELRPDLLNPAGAMQGAVVAGLGETAAEDLADHHRAMGTGCHVVSEIDVLYLAQNRVPPIVTRARFVGAPTEGLIRVDLVDDGGSGRLTNALTVRVRPAPG